MQRWKHCCKSGNFCFRAGALSDACGHYLTALGLAQRMFDCPSDVDEATAALVVSHHNLADLYVQLGQPETALEYLTQVHECLARASEDPKRPADLRQAALRHRQRTYMELLAFHRRHGDNSSHPGLQLAISRQQAWLAHSQTYYGEH